MLKERRPSVKDIECLAREISDNPDDLKKFYELLRLSDDELKDLKEPGTDRVDGAPILSHRLTPNRCADITYERIAASLPNRRDLVVKYCKSEPPHTHKHKYTLKSNFFLLFQLKYKRLGSRQRRIHKYLFLTT